MKLTSDGDLPNLFADSLGDGKFKPVGEFRDFMGQLRDRDFARASYGGGEVTEGFRLTGQEVGGYFVHGCPVRQEPFRKIKFDILPRRIQIADIILFQQAV